MKNLFIGIDFSKGTIDVSFFEQEKRNEIKYLSFMNDKQGFKAMLTWIGQQTKLPRKEWLFCGENTGFYSLSLGEFLTKKGLFIWLDNPLQIKLCMGIKRDKNDKVDSRDIALYAYRYQDKAKQYVLMSKENKGLRVLYAQRKRLIKAKMLLAQGATETREMIAHNTDTHFLYEQTDQLINLIDKKIEAVDTRMQEIMDSSTELKENYELVTSIKGIGAVNAIAFIILTDNFTLFDNPRQFACHTGMAPFGQESGTSIHKTPKTSKTANKDMKPLLTQAARSAVRYNVELRTYYQRKISEGKKDKVVINNVRNKLIHRVFAVIKHRTPYMDNYSMQN